MALHCIVVTFRRYGQLVDVIGGILDQTRAPDSLMIVDNEGDDRVRLLAESTAGRLPVRYVRAPENLGPAGGTALAMLEFERGLSDDDWILRVDDDHPPDFADVFERIEALGDELLVTDDRVAGVGVVGARYDWRRGRLIRVPSEELEGAVGVDYLATNQFPAFRVAAIRDVGPFRADLFYGSSEVEFGLRLRRAGWNLYADGDLWRRFGRASESFAGPRYGLEPYGWRRFYSLRNQIWLLREAGRPLTGLRVAVVRGFAKPLLNLPRHPRLALRHLRLNGRAVRDGWTGKLGRTMEPDDRSAGPAPHRPAG